MPLDLVWTVVRLETEGSAEAGPGPWWALAGVLSITAAAVRVERLWREVPRGWE